MNKIIGLTFVAVAAELSRRILIWLASDPSRSAGATTYDARHDGSSQLLDRLGAALKVDQFDTTSLILFPTALALASAAVGMASHLALGNRAFGATVNGYIMFFSALFTGAGWLSFGPPALTEREDLLVLLATLGALSGLFACLLLRRAWFDYLEAQIAETARAQRPGPEERRLAATRRTR